MSESKMAQALGKITSGIFIVTAKKGEEETAMLASWLQQASFQPPTISLSVHKDRPIDQFLSEDSAFVVNILQKDEKSLFKHFATGFALGKNPYHGIDTKDSTTGSKILSRAMAVLECRVRTR